jgi:3-phytase
MIKKLTTVLSAAGAMLLAAPAAFAAPFVVFGDSLSDAGSAQLASAQLGAPDPTPASLGYFRGRFSNGPVAVDYVNRFLNGELTTSYLLGGDNYAFGGAAIITDVNQGPGRLPVGIPDLTDQIDAFLGSGPVDPATDFYVGIGGNDFLALGSGLITGAELLAQALPTLATQLTRLADAGAQNVAVSNVGFIGNPVAAEYNARLSQLLVDLTMQTGTKFTLVDRNAVFADILANPTAYGLDPSLFGTSCIEVPGASPECEGFLLFDPVHTTTLTQRIFSNEINRALGVEVPLPAAAVFLATGLAGFALRRKKG